MSKKLLLSLCFSLYMLPAFAAGTLRTDPNDTVSVYSAGYKNDATPIYEKTYKKAWANIKLDAKTVAKMKTILSQSEPYREYDEIFRVVHLVIINDQVQRVLFVSDGGVAIGIEMLGGSSVTRRHCLVSIGGNGSIVGECNE